MTKILTNIAIPYMGSKRRIALEIISFITKRHPEAENFYDIFGGGGAMSFMAMQIPQFKNVYYNEINTQIVELIRYCQSPPTDRSRYKLGEIYPDKFYEWVSRETFFKHNYDKDYYGGLLSTCWSFGNKQTSYLFGKDVEEVKRIAHMVCVYRDESALRELNKIVKVGNEILLHNSIYSRRMFLKSCVKNNRDVSDL